MRKTSHAELCPETQARASASSSTRSVNKKARASLCVTPLGRYFPATSHRTAANASGVRPILSQPPFACSSASRSATADCTSREMGFVAGMKMKEGRGELKRHNPRCYQLLDACNVNFVRKLSLPFRSSRGVETSGTVLRGYNGNKYYRCSPRSQTSRRARGELCVQDYLWHWQLLCS